jgi:hypothetical protein
MAEQHWPTSTKSKKKPLPLLHTLSCVECASLPEYTEWEPPQEGDQSDEITSTKPTFRDGFPPWVGGCLPIPLYAIVDNNTFFCRWFSRSARKKLRYERTQYSQLKEKGDWCTSYDHWAENRGSMHVLKYFFNSFILFWKICPSVFTCWLEFYGVCLSFHIRSFFT